MAVVEEFAVGSLNIKNTPDIPRAKVRQLASMVPAEVGIVGFQEIAEGDKGSLGGEDDADVEAGLGAGWAHWHAGSENKISAKTDRWRQADPSNMSRRVSVVSAKHLSQGMTGVSPSRNLTHVALEWVNRPTWVPFVFGNTHMIVVKRDGAFLFREEARAEELDGISSWATRMYNMGHNAILTLDSNWGKMPKPHPEWVWCVNDGIDKVGFLNSPGSNWNLGFVSKEIHPNPVEPGHPFVVANLRATARPVKPTPTPGPVTVAAQVEAWLARPSVSAVVRASDGLDLRAIVRGV